MKGYELIGCVIGRADSRSDLQSVFDFNCCGAQEYNGMGHQSLPKRMSTSALTTDCLQGFWENLYNRTMLLYVDFVPGLLPSGVVSC